MNSYSSVYPGAARIAEALSGLPLIFKGNELDKRAPQRQVVTGAVVNPTASLGNSTANAPQLSPSEYNALKEQLTRCWNVPAGVQDAKELNVYVQFTLNRDGTVYGQPVVTNHEKHAMFPIMAESAMRAVLSCQPFRLPAAKYEYWQEMEVKFNPREMFGG